MRKFLFGAAATLTLAACGGNPAPDSGPMAATSRSQCDGYAARAIQAQDLGVATTLAAQASECYSTLLTRR